MASAQVLAVTTTPISNSPLLNASCIQRYLISRCFIIPRPRFATTPRAALKVDVLELHLLQDRDHKLASDCTCAHSE
eukprot:7517653-Heterocapsa_arctica.AAC.1